MIITDYGLNNNNVLWKVCIVLNNEIEYLGKLPIRNTHRLF